VNLTALRPAAALALLTGPLLLTGCGSEAIKPAPGAATPACTALTGRLPGQVLGRSRNQLSVAGAASWGKPAIVLRCGVSPPGPTTDACLGVNGLDWVFTETKHTLRFVSYGRNPAVEVTVPVSVGRTGATGALVDLAAAVRPITAGTNCT